jgi:hypothetical protein
LSAADAEGQLAPDYTGVYTVTLRATDEPGNCTAPENYVTFNLVVDEAAPLSTLRFPDPGQVLDVGGVLTITQGTDLLTSTTTISGTVAEGHVFESGVAAQEIRLAPVGQSVASELWRADYFSGTVPFGVPDLTRMDVSASDGGLAFDWGADAPAPGLPADDFSAAWMRDTLFRASGVYSFTLAKDADATAQVLLDDEAILSVAQGATSGAVAQHVERGVHRLRVRYGEHSGEARLDLDVTLVEADWSAATLAAAGTGVSSTTWQHPLSSGFEGLYQVDLRAADTLGNVFAGALAH